jgi:hypothetical protein
MPHRGGVFNQTGGGVTGRVTFWPGGGAGVGGEEGFLWEDDDDGGDADPNRSAPRPAGTGARTRAMHQQALLASQQLASRTRARRALIASISEEVEVDAGPAVSLPRGHLRKGAAPPRCRCVLSSTPSSALAS